MAVTRPLQPLGAFRVSAASVIGPAKFAQKLLRDFHAGCGSWAETATHFRLFTKAGQPDKTRAWLMAQGQRPVCAEMLKQAALRRVRFFRRFIRTVAVPFLDGRQVSRSGRYGRGGRVIA